VQRKPADAPLGRGGPNSRRCVLKASLFTLALLSGAPALAHPNTPDRSASINVDEVLCAGESLVGAEATVGEPGPETITLRFDGGGTCGGYTPPSRLTASNANSETTVRESCPAFRRQARELHPSAAREVRLRDDGSGDPSVKAGPFRITNWAGYFELDSAEGRSAAEKWMRQTLSAVRRCWDLSHDHDTPRLIDRLYLDIAAPNPP
jgi:hypothetical protein